MQLEMKAFKSTFLDSAIGFPIALKGVRIKKADNFEDASLGRPLASLAPLKLSYFLGWRIQCDRDYSSASGSVLMRDVFLNLRRELLKNPHYQLVPSEVRAPSFFFCVWCASFQ